MDANSLSDVISSLSNDDIQKLQGIANSILNNNSPQPSQQPAPSGLNGMDLNSLLAGLGSQQNQSGNLPVQNDSFNLDPEMLGKITAIMQKLNGVNQDKRYIFLSALKPMLSEQKQKRADDAMKMLRLFELLPLLKESGIFNNLL